ncbi:hypothetical protein Tco_0032642 [Tanacetum coccineum]
MKCHQSPEYGAAFGAVTGLAINKGIQAGLVAGPSTETLETSLFDSLEVIHARVQKLKDDTLSHRLSIFGAMGVLAAPISFENLIGEASTSGGPVTAVATTALDTAPHSLKIVFKKEDLETSPEHPSASYSLGIRLAKPLTLSFKASLFIQSFLYSFSQASVLSFHQVVGLRMLDEGEALADI